MENFPIGFRFVPTDEELIEFFLHKKLNGENLPHEDIQECEIYGDEEPWKLFDKDVKHTFYVFVKLKRKSENMIQRTAGSGTWSGRNFEEVYDSEGQLIGINKLLTFRVKGEDRANGHWVMHEFSSLSGGDYVVCAIRNKDQDNAESSNIKTIKTSRKRGLENQENHPSKRVRMAIVPNSNTMQLLQGAQSYGAGEPAVYQESAVPPLEEPTVYQESKEENTTQEPWVEGGAEQFVDDQNIGDCLEKNLDLEGHGEFEHQESVAQLLVEPIVYEEYMEERNQEPRVDDNDWLVQLLDVEEEARQNDLIIDDVEEARQDDPIIDEARQNSTSNVEETRQDDPIIDNDQFQTGEGSMIVAEPEVAAPIGNIDRFETKNSGVMLVVEPEVEFAFQN